MDRKWKDERRVQKYSDLSREVKKMGRNVELKKYDTRSKECKTLCRGGGGH